MSSTTSDPVGNEADRVIVSVPNCKIVGNDNSNNVAATLSAAGYHTIMSGKWHLLDSRPDWTVYNDVKTAVEDAGYRTVAGVYRDNIPGPTTANPSTPYPEVSMQWSSLLCAGATTLIMM